MKRRNFITLLGGAGRAGRGEVGAQQAGRTFASTSCTIRARSHRSSHPFYDELRRLGFVEGQNLIVDSRGYAVRTKRFSAVAAELVKAQVDAIGQASCPKPIKFRFRAVAMPIEVLRDAIDLVIEFGLGEPQQFIQKIHQPLGVLWHEYLPSFEQRRDKRPTNKLGTCKRDGNGLDAVALL